jgi:hypothetical protein
MLNNLLLVVADRGGLKAFRVESNPPPRPPRLRQVQSLELTISHGRYADKVTDQAGRFGTSTPGVGGSAEHTTIELENSRRAVKQVAEQIVAVVKQEKSEGLLLAAPALMNTALVEELPPDLRNLLVENVSADLRKTDAAKLASHFHSLQGRAIA